MSSWEIRWSNSRQLPYFYNSSTQESTWESPPGISNDQIQTLPGAHYLNGNQGQAPSGKVRASHLLIKHAQSRRPSSWKEVRIRVLYHASASTSNVAADTKTIPTDSKTSLDPLKRPRKSFDSILILSGQIPLQTSLLNWRLSIRKYIRIPRCAKCNSFVRLTPDCSSQRLLLCAEGR